MSCWVNDFEEFWARRNEWADVLENPIESSFQIEFVDRDQGKVNLSLCNHPFTQQPLSDLDSFLLLANALRTYPKNKWNFKPKVSKVRDYGGNFKTFESAVFYTQIINNGNNKNIYVKIAINKDFKMLKISNRKKIIVHRVKIWSYHQ